MTTSWRPLVVRVYLTDEDKDLICGMCGCSFFLLEPFVLMALCYKCVIVDIYKNRN